MRQRRCVVYVYVVICAHAKLSTQKSATRHLASFSPFASLCKEATLKQKYVIVNDSHCALLKTWKGIFLLHTFTVVENIKMSESKQQLQAGQELIKKSMDEVIQQRQTTEKVTIQAKQEFREHFQSSYEEEFEEETFIDEFGNETTKRVESSSESSEHSKSADVKVKATGLNDKQVKALTDCANQAGQLALDSKAAN